MKAIIWTRYGPPDVLQLREVEKPTPKDNEVLIKIHATTVTAGDCEMRALNLPPLLALPIRIYAGVIRPTRMTVIGQELAGEIEAVGKDVSLFKVGDQVIAGTGFGYGTYAEYVCFPERPGDMDGVIAIKPANLSYEQAAAIPTGGLEALHFLRKGDIQSGDKLLINGAGGSIGTFAVQLAKHYGAEVTGVDSGPKLDMLRSIGADHVIDYTQEDFAQRDETYDAIFDVVGKRSFARCIRSLKPDGRYLLANPRLSTVLRGLWISARSAKKVLTATAGRAPEDLAFLTELIEAGKITPVIDRRYLLEQVAEAHRYVETGQKQGNLVITVGSRDQT